MVETTELPVKSVQQADALLFFLTCLKLFYYRLVDNEELVFNLTFQMVAASLNTIKVVRQLVCLVSQTSTEPVGQVIDCSFWQILEGDYFTNQCQTSKAFAG